MSYTNEELLRPYLESAQPVSEYITDQALVMAGQEYLQFFSGTVAEGSVTVKSIQSHHPVRVAKTFSEATIVLATTPLVAGTVVVAADSSLGTVYTPNVDYAVDYRQAQVTLKSGGQLGVGATVYVWYAPHVLYTSGSDFALDVDTGRVRRLPNGDIADGETVWLDYRPSPIGVDDTLLANAVAEANGTIEREIDPAGQFGADPCLQAAASYRALAIVCRAAAMRGLVLHPESDRMAVAWLRLGEAFSERSELQIASFRPPLTGPAAPDHT